jgi:GNAT acetyltransferase-like protein
MNAAAIEVEVTEPSPPDPAAWDAVARDRGNLAQSTAFDRSEAFYGMVPVYFTATCRGQLWGGVKLYRSTSRRWRPITRGLSLGFTQFGESLIAPAAVSGPEVQSALDAAVARHLKAVGAVWLRVSGLYGGEGLVELPLAPFSESPFNVASIDLARPEAELWASAHKSHRSEVRKAERNAVAFVRDSSVARLVGLLDETYRDQEKPGPNRSYVRHVVESLDGAADLFFAVRGGEYLSGALCLWHGDVAYWQFGGSVRQNLGAGAFLQWRMIQHYQQRGMKRYVLGQVAAAGDSANAKFAVGISRFKRHFGPEETPSTTRLYVLRPARHSIWSRLLAGAAFLRSYTGWTTTR